MSAASFPLSSQALRQFYARRDICPECGGELDTGWECLRCGYDAQRDAQLSVVQIEPEPKP
jgi:tRNA(Ile2) C34 agmatinyltransferase TiaS